MEEAPEEGRDQTGDPEPSGGGHDGADRAIERGGRVGPDQEGEEVAGGLRVKDERGNASEAAAGDDFEGALGSAQIFGIAEAEVDDGDGEKSAQGNYRGGKPNGEDGGGDDKIDADGCGEGAPRTAGGALDQCQVERAVGESEDGDGCGEEGQLNGERKRWDQRGNDEGQREESHNREGVAATEGGEPSVHRSAAARKGAGGRARMTCRISAGRGSDSRKRMSASGGTRSKRRVK